MEYFSYSLVYSKLLSLSLSSILFLSFYLWMNLTHHHIHVFLIRILILTHDVSVSPFEIIFKVKEFHWITECCISLYPIQQVFTTFFNTRIIVI